MTRRRNPVFRCALSAALLGGSLAAALPLAAQTPTPQAPAPVVSPAPAAPAPAAATTPVAPAGSAAIAVQPAAAGAAAAAAPAPAGEPVVRGVRSDRDDQPTRAGLGDRIAVLVDRLDLLLARTDGGCGGIVLFLDGIAINGVPPVSCNEAEGSVRFELERSDDSDRAWHMLLGEPPGLHRKVRVSLGPNGTSPVRSAMLDFELEILPVFAFGLYLAGLALVLALLVHLSRNTALLRDPHAPPPPGARAPYSLARFQLAFWSFLVVAAYVFLWMITEELDTITGSVLGLLGIGAGTALGSSVIDAGKEAKAEAAASAEAAPAVPAARAASAPIAPLAASASQGFLRDLLQDAEGVSLYRFQMFVWTLVLGIIFFASVYEKLAMPSFSPSLLGLMGISSGTFLGAKFPEDRAKG